jgi:hypothetical protein
VSRIFSPFASPGRYLSSTPHGTLHGLLRNTHMVEGLPAEWTGTMAAQEVNPSELALFSAWVLLAYVEAADRQMAYFGWTRPAWDAWKAALLAKIEPQMPGAVMRMSGL